MLTSDTPSIEESVSFARMLAETDDAQRVEIVHRLRHSLQLSRTVRGLNHLLEQPAHRPVGRQALKSLGLEQGG
jgi:hypothetical protein